MRLWLYLLCVALALCACPDTRTKRAGSGVGSAAACSKSYARCRLPQKGPLGVCMPATCPPGKQRPCYRCTPQH